MGNVPNLIDIDFYCDTLSDITGLDIEQVRMIVVLNFSKIYKSNNQTLDFTDVTEKIESEIGEALDKQKEGKVIQLTTF